MNYNQYNQIHPRLVSQLNLDEAIILLKKSIYHLELAFNNENCPNKDSYFELLVKSNRLLVDMIKEKESKKELIE